MSLTAAEIPLVEIPGPDENPEQAGEAARFILANLYRQTDPDADRLAEQLADMRRRTTIAAFDGDLLLATGSLEIGLPHQGRLDDIAVLNQEGYRRIGLGTKIVQRLEAMAAEAEAQEITFVSAATALAFYQKLGYTVDKATCMCMKGVVAEAGPAED